jgi:flagellar assembly protein FliH
MKSSARLAPAPPSPPDLAQAKRLDVAPFSYCEVVPPPAAHQWSTASNLPAVQRSSEAQTSAAKSAMSEARELGRQQGEREARAKFEEQLARERAALAAALTYFSRERAAYYQKIEREAVQLALNIAHKILHREAQVDPLLLMGIVRVALEQIEGATGVVLAVHPQQAPDWQRYLASRLEPADLPEIVEDPAMPVEKCELRTSMGTAQLGLEVQFKEIEQGLMDLLASRPGEQR